MHARVISLLASLVALLLMPMLALAENATIQNEFIKIVVNKGPAEAGRFSIDTTGGDPKLATSKNQQLIYGGGSPWTSITTVRIDETNYVFGGKTERRAGVNASYGDVIDGPKVDGDSIVTTCKFGDIVVTQTVGFDRGSISRMFDSAGIAYRIENQGRENHTVGLRVMLDTKLGPNDGAPIRAGEAKIEHALTLVDSKIPQTWMAFDKFIPDQTIVSQGTLRGSGLTPPHKVIFADWGTLADDIWEPALDPARGFVRKDEDEDDTACALFWNPVALEAGKSLTYVTDYGIGYVNGKKGELSIGINSSTTETTFEYERTQSFTVTGFLQNSSDRFDARNVKLTIKLPAGLEIVNKVTEKDYTRTAELLKPGEELQASWTIVPTGKVSGTVKITLVATSENMEQNQVDSDGIQTNVPKPKLVLVPGSATVPAITNKQPTTVFVAINLKPAVEFYGVHLVLSYDPAVLKLSRFSPIFRGDVFVDGAGERLLNGWECDTSEKGKILITAKRGNNQPLSRAEINLATITFRAAAEGKSVLKLEDAMLIDAQGAESPVATSAGQIEVRN